MPPVSVFLNMLWIVLCSTCMWLVDCRRGDVDHDYRPALGKSGTKYLYTLFVFGQRAVRRHRLTGESEISAGPFGVIGNLIWLVLSGLVARASASHDRCCWRQHHRHRLCVAHQLAGIVLWRIGKEIVPI